jgi:hypothetical protein
MGFGLLGVVWPPPKPIFAFFFSFSFLAFWGWPNHPRFSSSSSFLIYGQNNVVLACVSIVVLEPKTV